MATSATYSNPASSQDLQPLVFQAVSLVIAQHPSLSTIFLDAEDKSKPYFARLPEIDLRQCVIFVPRQSKVEEKSGNCDPEWDGVLEEYHNTRFDKSWGELPLWRLVVLHEPNDNSRFVACFIYQHTIGDGNAGPSFHRALLAELSFLSAAEDLQAIDPIVRCPDEPVPPSLESLHRLPLSPGYLLKMAWIDAFPSNSDRLWLGGPVSKPTRSRFLSYTFLADMTNKLLVVCRAHSVTITATCHALIALAIFVNLPAEKTRLKSSIAFDLRRFLPREVLENDLIGNYVAAPWVDLKRPASTSTISWAEAKRIKKALDNDIKRNGKDVSSACLRYVGDMHKYFESKFKKPRDGTFCLTNLGTFKRREGDSGPWRTGRMVFSEGFDASREAFDITMITGEDGCLSLGIVWGDGVVEEKFILHIFETLKTLLRQTASSQT